MKKVNDLLGKIGMLLVLVNLFVALISMLFFSPTVYRLFFQKHHLEVQTDLPLEKAEEAHAALLCYLRDQKDDILVADQPFFNARETFHMQDVKRLWQGICKLQMATVAGGFFLLVIGMRKENKRAALRRYTVSALCALSFLLLFVLLWMGADFNAFWSWIHHLLFRHNDFWRLDPNTSIMANMYPSSYWRMILMMGSFAFLLLLAIGIYIDFYYPSRL